MWIQILQISALNKNSGGKLWVLEILAHGDEILDFHEKIENLWNWAIQELGSEN